MAFVVVVVGGAGDYGNIRWDWQRSYVLAQVVSSLGSCRVLLLEHGRMDMHRRVRLNCSQVRTAVDYGRVYDSRWAMWSWSPLDWCCVVACAFASLT